MVTPCDHCARFFEPSIKYFAGNVDFSTDFQNATRLDSTRVDECPCFPALLSLVARSSRNRVLLRRILHLGPRGASVGAFSRLEVPAAIRPSADSEVQRALCPNLRFPTVLIYKSTASGDGLRWVTHWERPGAPILDGDARCCDLGWPCGGILGCSSTRTWAGMHSFLVQQAADQVLQWGDLA